MILDVLGVFVFLKKRKFTILDILGDFFKKREKIKSKLKKRRNRYIIFYQSGIKRIQSCT